MAALDFTTVHQGGDDGLTVLFPVEKVAAVAKIMRPRRRRQVSEAERERLAEMSEEFSPDYSRIWGILAPSGASKLL